MLTSLLKLQRELWDQRSDWCTRFTFHHSAIEGRSVECLYPSHWSQASNMEVHKSMRHVIFTAETHNFPTGQSVLNVSDHIAEGFSSPVGRKVGFSECFISLGRCRSLFQAWLRSAVQLQGPEVGYGTSSAQAEGPT